MIPNAWQGFDFGLGEDVDQLRDTARSFSQDKIAPPYSSSTVTPSSPTLPSSGHKSRGN